MLELLRLIIKSNTGYGSKTVVMLWGILMASLFLLSVITVIFIDLFTTYDSTTDWLGIAAVLAAISSFVGVSVYGKIKGEEYEYRDRNINNDLNQGD